MATFDEFVSSLDPENDKKGKQFEYFVKWFLKNDPEWSTQVDEVWMLDEYPDRWGPDLGVDLVFRHKNGEIWAVQAKCYNTKYSITKKDVGTFLSESNRSIIDKRLLISSTDQVGKNAREVCQAQEKPVTLYLHADFDKAAIDYPSDMSQLSSAKRKELPAPRPHQTKAIEDVIQGFGADDRGQMIMACGTGKTYTTLWVKEALNAKTTLVLLPSLSLLSQTLREWASASNEPFEALCVCSDETVGKQSNDELISSAQDVAFPTTSDPLVIKAFLERGVSKVVFSTYHSSPSIAEAQSGDSAQAFDLVIADEAHRCTGEAGKAFTTVLDSSLIKAKKRLFTTATPRTYSTNIKKKASEMGVDIADMSDEAYFGKEFHHLTFAQAIDKKLLTDYRVVIIGVDEPMISKWIENRELVRTDDGETTDAKTLASQIGLIKAIKDYDLKRMISFHSRVKGAELFAEDLHNAMDFVSDEHRPEGEIYTDFVSGKMSSYDRRLKLSQLKKLHNADRGLLTNARCLSEGVDVPSLDGVAFIDPKSSQVDIVQAVGRAIRKSDNKTTGTIVLPVFIEDVNNAEESLQSGNFKPIWSVLNALKSHDETLSFELDQLRTNLGRQGGDGSVGSLPEKIVFDLPKSVDKSFSDALKTIVIDRVTNSWEFWYGILLNYFDENCHSIVPTLYKTDNKYNLGQWVSTQRKEKERSLLSPERVQKLDELGFVWNTFKHLFNQGYQHLKQYVKDNGDALVSTKYKVDGFNLGTWVATQRKEEVKRRLSSERIQQLDELGFVWDTIEHAWNQGYQYLKQYVKDNGDTLVEKGYKVDGYNLATWVSNKRSAKASNKLSSERIQQLDELGFVWDTIEHAWNQGYQYLKQYVKDNGDTLVEKGYKVDGYNLATWVSNKRSAKASNKLSSERIQQLDELGFVWDTIEHAWNQGYQYLKQYVKDNGDTAVKTHYKADGFNLGQWVSVQRADKASNKLSSERIQKLDELGFIWDLFEYKWNQGYQHLKQYVEDNGDALVSQRSNKVDGFNLGVWCNSQRLKKESMTSDRFKKPDELDFVWDMLEYQWNQGYQHLKQYVEDNGDALVSQRSNKVDGFNLGTWVGSQRSAKASNKLPPEKIQKLDELGFVWIAR